MPVYRFDELRQELVTPKHSSAFGGLITVRITIGGRAHELGPREAAHMPPNVPHSLDALADTEVVSAKGIEAGVGHRI